MYCVNDSLDDDIDAIGIGGADVVAELGVAIGAIESMRALHKEELMSVLTN